MTTANPRCSQRAACHQRGAVAIRRSAPATAWSSRSASSDSFVVAARRASAGQGSGRPVAACTAIVRSAESTCARCTGEAGGSEVRACSCGSRPSPSRRSGSGRRRRSHAVHGTPDGERPAVPVGAFDGAHHAREPGGVRERGDELLAVTPADARRRARRPRPRGAARRRLHVGRQPCQRGLPVADAILDLGAQLLRALAGPRGQAEHGYVAEAVVAQHAAEILACAVTLPGEQVDLVEHHEHRRRVPGERLQVALVQRRVGVLLGVDDPHQQVDHRARDGRPPRGGSPRSSRSPAGRAAPGRRAHRHRARAVSGRRASPAARDRRPAATAAVVVAVVGRRTPGRESSLPGQER